MSDTGGRQQLQVGLKLSRTITVTDEMTPAHLRHEPIRELSTPDMIRLVEQTAIAAVQPCLAEGQASVGTRVDIAHLAATPVGMAGAIKGASKNTRKGRECAGPARGRCRPCG